MRTKIFLFVLLGLSFALGTAQQTIQVTPQSLAGWTVTGADQQTLAAQTNLSLPAGAQLARSFTADGLAVKFTTRPQIGATPADWPVLEIGAAALVFTRDGAAGKLALVLGDQTPVDLPVSFPLDAEGRSGEPLTINFTREGSVVTVEAGGQKMAFTADQFSGQRLEVVASAGAENSWAFARLEVALPVAEVMAPASGAGSRGSDATNATPSALDRKSDAAKSKPTTSRTGTVAGPDPTGAPATPAAIAGKAGASSLEIFTPPSVRHGRADTVRNTVATGLQK